MRLGKTLADELVKKFGDSRAAADAMGMAHARQINNLSLQEHVSTRTLFKVAAIVGVKPSTLLIRAEKRPE